MTIAHEDGISAARKARIAELERKLKARDGKPEYKKNCEEIRAEIDRLSWYDL